MFKLNLSDGNTLYVNDEKPLLEQLKDNNYYIKSNCGGHASCSDCVIRVSDGQDHLNKPTDAELKLLGNVFHITKERLACQTVVSGEVSIDISDHDQRSDEERREAKNKKVSANMKAGIKVRKKEEYDQIIEERKAKTAEKYADDETWFKPWEKGDQKAPKSRGGMRRPKQFKQDFSDEVDEKDDKKK